MKKTKNRDLLMEIIVDALNKLEEMEQKYEIGIKPTKKIIHIAYGSFKDIYSCSNCGNQFDSDEQHCCNCGVKRNPIDWSDE